MYRPIATLDLSSRIERASYGTLKRIRLLWALGIIGVS